jgi:hypothetical protein
MQFQRRRIVPPYDLVLTPVLDRRYLPLQMGATMRAVIILLLAMCAVSARANEDESLTEQIQGCMILPVAWMDSKLKATFELTLDDAGNIKNVAVISYSPHSLNSEEVHAAAQRILYRCPPLDTKKSPVRVNLDLRDWQ